jgi:hypothetical protein
MGKKDKDKGPDVGVAITFGHSSPEDRQVRRGVVTADTLEEAVTALDHMSKGGDVEIHDPQIAD